MRQKLKNNIVKFLKNIQDRFHLFFTGKDFTKKIATLENQVEFMSSIIAEQSRLMATVAVVQSDIASTMRESGIFDEKGKYITLKIPLPDSEQIN